MQCRSEDIDVMTISSVDYCYILWMKIGLLFYFNGKKNDLLHNAQIKTFKSCFLTIIIIIITSSLLLGDYVYYQMSLHGEKLKTLL